MKDLKKKLDLFVSKVHDEHNNSIKGGIIDTLIKPICEGEFGLNVTPEELIGSILFNKSIAYGIFERHFIKSNLRFKIFYKGKEIISKSMKEQIPDVLNLLGEETYIFVEKINKHLFNSMDEVKKSYKTNNKVFEPKNITFLNSKKCFDHSFNGTNPTINIKPCLDDLIKLDTQLTYESYIKKGYNNELLKAYL